MRRPHPGERAIIPKARYHPEGVAVDATGIWHEGHASYPGRSVILPLSGCATGVARRRDGAAEVSRGRSSRFHRADEGPNMKRRTEPGLSMATADAEGGAEMPRARPEGSGRKPREQGWVRQTSRQDRHSANRRRSAADGIDRQPRQHDGGPIPRGGTKARPASMDAGRGPEALPGGALAAHQRRTAGRSLPAAARARGGNTQARRRQPPAGHPDGGGPADPAGAASGADAAVRSTSKGAPVKFAGSRSACA